MRKALARTAMVLLLSASCLAGTLLPITVASATQTACADADDTLPTGTGIEGPDVCLFISWNDIVQSLNPPDPGVWQALPPTAKTLFLVASTRALPRVTTPGATAVDPDISTFNASASALALKPLTCASVTESREAEAAAGNVLWTYHQKHFTCWNGVNVKKSFRTRWGETSTPGWSFEGHIGSRKNGRVPAPYIARWTQGKFELCIVYCFQESDPWIEQGRYGTGTYATSQGG